MAAGATLALLATSCVASDTSSEPTPTPWPVATPDPDATPGPPSVSAELWAPYPRLTTARAPADDAAWYLVSKDGEVWRYDGTDRELIIDVTDEVSTDAEQGLFDFVVSPDGRFAYIHFTGVEEPFGDSHIREYRWTGSGVEGEPREVLVVTNPYPHHNGGQLQFGPDGYLYIGLGDGGTKEQTQEPDNGDPHDHGKRTDDLLGNILRIEPRGARDGEYSVPEDNPFVDDPDSRDEIWAYGLRNPWRFSFDRQTGDLWIPDVGHRFWEEINFQPAGSQGGENYGWSWLEGAADYKGDPPAGHMLPLYVYPHRGGPCAVIGGSVYRGTLVPDLHGWFVFGDFCTGELQAVLQRDGEVVDHRYLGVKVEMLVALAEDRDGELLAVSFSEGVYRVGPLGSVEP